MKKFFSIILAFILIISIGSVNFISNAETVKAGWITENGTRYLYDNSGKVVNGADKFIIDISKWQGTIDWDKLAKTGIDGVILRSSYGGQSYADKLQSKDSKFDEYIENLNRLNIPYGTYHFNTATTIEKAKIQATNVVNLLKESKANPTMPVFVDIETDGGECDLIAIAKVYISTFIANGYKPGIYANENYWKNYLNTNEFDAYYKWVANYGSNTGYPSYIFAAKEEIKNYGIWQYTSKGELSGISGNVDLNVLFDWFEKSDGWQKIAGKWYYYKNGYLANGWIKDNNKWYYFNNLGFMVPNNWEKDSKGWYCLDENGNKYTNAWVEDSEGWCYVGNDGYVVKNCWKMDSVGWCYINDQGRAETNKWVKDSIGWCYLDSEGHLVKNKWVKDSNGWVYLDYSGHMTKNKWVKDSSGWCYVNSSGYLIRNKWLKDSKGWVYLDNNGRMATNKWLKDSQGWCYVGADGYCIKNKWIKDSKGWVYVDYSGYMATNKWVKDSRGWCYVGFDGYAVKNKWQKDTSGWCYLDFNGNMVKSKWVKTDGKWYYLDANGYMVANKALIISGKRYRFNSNGVCTNP